MRFCILTISTGETVDRWEVYRSREAALRQKVSRCRKSAFAHCLIAVALNEALHHESHGAFRHIAHHMDAAQGGNQWRSRFGSKTPSALLSRTPEQ